MVLKGILDAVHSELQKGKNVATLMVHAEAARTAHGALAALTRRLNRQKGYPKVFFDNADYFCVTVDLLYKKLWSTIERINCVLRMSADALFDGKNSEPAKMFWNDFRALLEKAKEGLTEMQKSLNEHEGKVLCQVTQGKPDFCSIAKS